MDLFAHFPLGKINSGSITYPDPTDLNAYHFFKNNLGQRFKMKESSAARYSAAAFALANGIYQLVRIDPAQAGAIGTVVNGRPMFWSNKASWLVTTEYTVDSIFAGVALNTADLKGDLIFIQIQGKAPALCRATAMTKAGAIGDIAVLLAAASLGTFDNAADATPITFANFPDIRGQFVEIPVINLVKFVDLFNWTENFYDGII